MLDARERRTANSLAHVLVGVAALIIALSVLIFVIYLMVAELKAVPFDSDGVRCYARALSVECLQVTRN